MPDVEQRAWGLLNDLVLSPKSWPLWLRRTFLLTLPVTGPFLAAFVMIVALTLMACAFVAIIWLEVVRPLFGLWKEPTP